MKLRTRYFSDQYYCDRLLRRPDTQASEWSNSNSTWKARLGHEVCAYPRRPWAYPLEPIAQPRTQADRAWRHYLAARLLCRRIRPALDSAAGSDRRFHACL